MSKSDQFIQPSLHAYNIDRFVMRAAIYRALNEALDSFNGRLLDVGCGKMPYRDHILSISKVSEYIGIDLEGANYHREGDAGPDFSWDGNEIPFENKSFDTVIATEVLEHCPTPSNLLKETVRVLKPDGVFFFTVPFIWPLHEIPHDEFRYTPFSLGRILRDAGFTNVELQATGGWDAVLAQMLGLWALRGIGGRKGQIMASLLRPIISVLINRDQIPLEFGESQMILGLSGICRL